MKASHNWKARSYCRISLLLRYNLKASHNLLTYVSVGGALLLRYNLKASHNSRQSFKQGKQLLLRYNLKASHNSSAFALISFLLLLRYSLKDINTPTMTLLLKLNQRIKSNTSPSTLFISICKCDFLVFVRLILILILSGCLKHFMPDTLSNLYIDLKWKLYSLL